MGIVDLLHRETAALKRNGSRFMALELHWHPRYFERFERAWYEPEPLLNFHALRTCPFLTEFYVGGVIGVRGGGS